MPPDWWNEHRELLFWLAFASVGFLAISLVTLPWLLALLPVDWFSSENPPELAWQVDHPAWSLLIRVGRNLLGVVLLLAGIAMLVLPGQGLFTIVAALVLIDLPGKRSLEIYLVRKPRVLASLNWLRRFRGVAPFERP